MRTRFLLATCLLTLPLVAQKAHPAAQAAAQPKAVVNWDGEWSRLAAKGDDLDQRIGDQVKDMNFALRFYWKKKLESACKAYDHLDILAGDSFSVALGKEPPIDTPADGTVVDWKNRDGDAFKASLTQDGPTLIQTLRGDGYTLQYVYSMRPDGKTLALEVTYTHPKLDSAFSYKLVFKRIESD